MNRFKNRLQPCRGIAQLVEQWSPKPRAVGSNPTAPAKMFSGWRISGNRGVAQFGSATGLGPVGRGFKSCHPDHFHKEIWKRLCSFDKIEKVFGAFYISFTCMKILFCIKLAALLRQNGPLAQLVRASGS